MKIKKLSILFQFLLLGHVQGYNQTNSFDVFTFQQPAYFSKKELPSNLQFFLKNNDTSFCRITLHKNMPAKDNVLKDITSQWNEYVVKHLSKANTKPGKIMTEQIWDGWTSTLAIGNFYQKKKKCVVMLYSFRKNNTTACVVYEMSDKIFKGPIETFSQHLHLTKQL